MIKETFDKPSRQKKQFANYGSTRRRRISVSSLLSSKLGLRVEKEDIDIAQRIGKYHREKIRPVIVRFIRRQTKSDVMRNAKLLKGSGIFLNKDLTKLNAEDLETVERAWSFDGKLYARFRGKERSEIIDYEHFQTWLYKPLPKAHKSTPN
ncbi:hypothetical protein DPMN_080045 [Dreissena polymorpha]|uniref:Uncharacterized protein n=1 Tax=Dreissena polymorpha TaxID=45954 RepID=A0A9D3YVL5_DREPO|nr:hypothetical protein DPMN_080045 [Dreissena polymorpha]